MKIGELAKNAGCAVETIRYYEKQGLMPAPARSHNNYREYRAEHVERLVFIRNCRALDMSLEEIQRLIGLRHSAADNCSAINQLLDEHLAHVQSRIDNLQLLHQQLSDLRQRCQRPSEAPCPIVEQLSNSGAAPAPNDEQNNHLARSHRH